MEQGWECIKCHNVYAPNIPFCLYCWFQSHNNNNNNNINPPNNAPEESIVKENIVPDQEKTIPVLEQTNKNLFFQKVECTIPILNKDPTYTQSENYPDTKIFLCGMGHAKERSMARTFKIPYILDSIVDFPISPSKLVRQYFDYLKSNNIEYLLDSGAFSYMNNPKKSINLEEHIKQYCYYINEFDINNFFELDLDIFLPLEDIENIRKKIYLETHKQPIIVHHVERGQNYWIKTCKENNYVAMGGMASMQKEGGVDYEFYEGLVDQAHTYGTKVHGLGCTPLSLLNSRSMFFDTVDSTSWNFNKRGHMAALDEHGNLIRLPLTDQFFNSIEAQEEDLKIWAQFAMDYKGGPRPQGAMR